ncbi:hypothetical protein [Streptomyces decoyicus]
MSGWSTTVTAPSGAVHTGPGPQTNHNYYLGGTHAEQSARNRDPRLVAEDELVWLDRRFIASPPLGDARQALPRTHVVLLTGSPGSGVRSAAKTVLHGLRTQTGRFHELTTATEDEKRFGLDHSAVADDDRLLLDLTHLQEEARAVILHDLLPFLSTVREHRAHLAVALPPLVRRELPTELTPHLTEIERPNGRAVFRRHLRADGIVPTNDTSPRLRDILAVAPMREIAGLAHLICRARDRQPHGGFPAWQDAALHAWADNKEDVAKLVAARTTGAQRSLLLATAMLHGARADAIHDASLALLTWARQPVIDTVPLQGPGLAHLLRSVNASPDSDDQVTFTTLEFDPAVREHFWNNHPPLRAALRDWVAECVSLASLSPQDRDALVWRFAEHALRTESADMMLGLAEQWTTQEPDQVRGRAAGEALSAALRHERHGPAARRRTYEWCIRSDLPTELAAVLVSVCERVVAVNHPDQAMVRLHHLSRRRFGAADEARAALLRLARGDNRLCRRLLHRVTNGLTRSPASPDHTLFLQLADPVRLTDISHRSQPFVSDRAVRRQLAICWQEVLARRPLSEWQYRLMHWLNLCAADTQCSDRLLDVLAEAGAARRDLTAHLYASALDWAETPGSDFPLEGRAGRAARIAVTDRLWRLLDRAEAPPSSVSDPV